MTLTRLAAASAALLARAGIARAEPELDIDDHRDLDYDFRGITQTAQDPAVRAASTSPWKAVPIWGSGRATSTSGTIRIPTWRSTYWRLQRVHQRRPWL
ncbi:MAG: hypothetical protein MZV49_04910 [Rhodopseudomonas palustris]|nr:hypothetical protein [Rhodopseudomonas palustris]